MRITHRLKLLDLIVGEVELIPDSLGQTSLCPGSTHGSIASLHPSVALTDCAPDSPARREDLVELLFLLIRQDLCEGSPETCPVLGVEGHALLTC